MSEELSDKDFRALISLLDDEDPRISEMVWSKLMSMGQEGVLRLEEAWEEEEDPGIQQKIEEIISKITLDDVADQLLNWRKGGGSDLLEGWYLLTRFQFPELDFQRYKNEISRLVNKSWLELNNRMGIVDKLRVMNHILFVLETYRPNKKNAYQPDNYFLNYVIDAKKGNPISLSVLYMLIANKLDIPLYGVILPGYFLLYYHDDQTEFYIDVYNGGIFITRAELKRFLKELNVPEKSSYFKPTSNIYIILQMLRGLAHDYNKQGRREKVEQLEELYKKIEIKFS